MEYNIFCDKCGKNIATVIDYCDSLNSYNDALYIYNNNYKNKIEIDFNSLDYTVNLCDNCKEELSIFLRNKYYEIKKELKERFQAVFYE